LPAGKAIVADHREPQVDVTSVLLVVATKCRPGNDTDCAGTSMAARPTKRGAPADALAALD
jgi:hypothetical protein